MSAAAEQPAQHNPDVAVTFAATLIDQWRRRGVRHVIVSPGSRSTPLVIGLQWVLDRQRAGEGDGGAVLRAHLVLDERSAAFQAVGVARATGAPAVLVCTSGTAAVEYHPAVVEAHLAALPLLICTADRPPELRDTGAPQTIDQRRLYGTSVRSYLEPGPPVTAGRDRWRALADDAFDAATGAQPGPVQLNLAFREPLVGAVGELPAAVPAIVDDRSDDVARSAPTRSAADIEALTRQCDARRVVVIAGERATLRSAPARVAQAGRDVGAILDAAEALGWPVLADPLSGLRLDHPAVVPNFDPVLRSDSAAAALLPEVVIRLGALASSKVTGQWLAAVPDQIAIDPAGWFPDPDRTISHQVHSAPASVFEALAVACGSGRLTGAPAEWTERWRRVSDRVEAALDEGRPDVTEAAALAAVLDGMPDGGHLIVSSSMPIRDLEWFGPTVPAGVTVHSNRGANGIDGVIATAVGVARTGAPTAVVVGDLALLHDVGSLVSASAVDNLAIVVVDNDGGGIFSFLPQQRLLAARDFERWWGTPSGLDAGVVAAGFGLDVIDVEPSTLAVPLRHRLTVASPARGADLAEVDEVGEAGVPGRVVRRAPLFRVVSDRATNLAQHQHLLQRLADIAELALGPNP